MKKIYSIVIAAVFCVLPTAVFCQQKHITEDLTMVIPEGYTQIKIDKDEYPNLSWTVYYGVNDTSYLLVMAIPKEIELADGRVGKMSERYQNIKTIDNMFLSQDRYRCVDTTREKFYQWTYHYVKKTFIDSSGWYSYTFASKTNDHLIFIIYGNKSNDNYAGLNEILSTLKYKINVVMMVEHLLVCADWRLVIIFFWFLAVFAFIILAEVDKMWKITLVCFSILFFLITAGTRHIGYTLAIVALFVLSMLYGFYKEKF